ncbi:MAG: hypothetical protein BWY63_02923 [Chloroflexi bacterium ADurb.Bin360]|nr:MAG: hypothetical protein BWY63_02923 [Chloroflexi bacterium ADurb.Bin360]
MRPHMCATEVTGTLHMFPHRGAFERRARFILFVEGDVLIKECQVAGLF